MVQQTYQEYRVQQPRQGLASQNTIFYPQNLVSTQTDQPLQTQYPTSTQPYQTLQIHINHFQIAQIIQEINHLITLTTEVDHQIKEIHEIPHKTDIVDHTVEKLNIEITDHHQTQIDRTIRLIKAPIHILGIDNIQIIDQETHRAIDTEIIPTIETKAIQIVEINDIIIDHEIIQTTDQIDKAQVTTIIIIDHQKIH